MSIIKADVVGKKTFLSEVRTTPLNLFSAFKLFFRSEIDRSTNSGVLIALRIAGFQLCVSPLLMQNLNIWNFHSSLTLNIGKLIRYFRRPWYAIMSNMTLFFILFGTREENGLF